MMRTPQQRAPAFRQQFTFATAIPIREPLPATPTTSLAGDRPEAPQPLFAPPPPQLDGTLERRWMAVVSSGDRWSGMDGTASIVPFLLTLTPGMAIVIQYDCQPSAYAVFQGFEGDYVLLSNYLGVPGVIRVLAPTINAVSVF